MCYVQMTTGSARVHRNQIIHMCIDNTTIVKQMICNGDEIPEKQIKIGENGVYNIEVII